MAFVLAGGLGTRLRSVVSNVPKPMAQIASRPFLEWLFDYWIGQGVTSFVVCVGYKRDVIIAHFGDEYRGCSITYVVEEAPLGTGGALLNAIRQTSQEHPFILLNGDTMFTVPMKELLAEERITNFGVVFSVFSAQEAGRYGAVELDETGSVTSFRGDKAKVNQLANGGVYAINPSLIRNELFAYSGPCSFEEDILPRLSLSGVRFAGVISNSSFIDIGVPSDYAAAQTVLTNT